MGKSDLQIGLHPMKIMKNQENKNSKLWRFAKEIKMLTITMKSDSPREAAGILEEVLEKEALRLRYGMNLARNRLKKFEKKYNISSEIFIKEWAAEDLDGKDMEYVEWAGEYQFYAGLNERLRILESIENVSL